MKITDVVKYIFGREPRGPVGYLCVLLVDTTKSFADTLLMLKQLQLASFVQLRGLEIKVFVFFLQNPRNSWFSRDGSVFPRQSTRP